MPVLSEVVGFAAPEGLGGRWGEFKYHLLEVVPYAESIRGQNRLDDTYSVTLSDTLLGGKPHGTF